MPASRLASALPPTDSSSIPSAERRRTAIVRPMTAAAISTLSGSPSQ
jgi:hypothetical protein